MSARSRSAQLVWRFDSLVQRDGFEQCLNSGAGGLGERRGLLGDPLLEVVEVVTEAPAPRNPAGKCISVEPVRPECRQHAGRRQSETGGK